MNKILSLFIALILSLGLFNELRITGFPRVEDSNNYSWFMFASGLVDNQSDMPSNWRSHYLSCAMSGRWFKLWNNSDQMVQTPTENGLRCVIFPPEVQYKHCDMVASFYALFFLLTCVTLVAFLNDPIVPMLGTAGSILFSAPGYLSPYLMPWDLPTMTAWTIVVLIYLNMESKQKWIWLACAVVFCGLLKETVLVTALFFIGAPWNWPKRIAAIVGIVIFSQLLNWGLFGARPDWMFSVHEAGSAGSNKWDPLMLWPTLLANAGSLALMPWLLWNKRDLPLATVCGTFIVLQALNNLACGVYNENRNWLELAPIGWILIGEYLKINPKRLENGEDKQKTHAVETGLIASNVAHK